jgi:hypothetical protein
MDGAMRSAVNDAVTATPSPRLPELLFRDEPPSAAPPVERQLEALEAAVATLVDELRIQRDLLARPPSQRARGQHAVSGSPVWLFVSTPAGYVLAEHEPEDPLERDSVVSVAGRDYRVTGRGRSPLLDDRACLYLEPMAPPRAERGDQQAA